MEKTLTISTALVTFFSSDNLRVSVMRKKSNDDDEILRGCPSIAREIQETERRTYTLLEKHVLPAWKELGVWVSTRSRLRAHYQQKEHA